MFNNRGSFSNLLRNMLEKIERASNILQDELDNLTNIKSSDFSDVAKASSAIPKSKEQKTRPRPSKFKFSHYDIWRSSRCPQGEFPSDFEECTPTQGGSFQLFSKAQLKEKLAVVEAEPEAMTHVYSKQ
ncbi:MAG: hypothetical protein ACYCQI_13710 [Gammaproteobacteria bacterium]